MILTKDVTGYKVGSKVFEKGSVYTDERGIAYIDQGYHLALMESQRTGEPIVTLGEERVVVEARAAAQVAADKAEKAAARPTRTRRQVG